MTHAQALHQLKIAKRTGEAEAKRQVCEYCWDRWGFRPSRFWSPDPMVEFDDLVQEFWLGMLSGIEKDKGLGDRLFYVAKSGYWRISSLIKAVAIRYVSPGTTDEDGNSPEYPSVHSEDPETTVVRKLSAQQATVLLLDCPDGIVKRMATAIMEDDEDRDPEERIGAPDELGHNKRLAASLGVSAQRASVGMTKLREHAAKQGIDADDLAI